MKRYVNKRKKNKKLADEKKRFIEDKADMEATINFLTDENNKLKRRIEELTLPTDLPPVNPDLKITKELHERGYSAQPQLKRNKRN